MQTDGSAVAARKCMSPCCANACIAKPPPATRGTQRTYMRRCQAKNLGERFCRFRLRGELNQTPTNNLSPTVYTLSFLVRRTWVQTTSKNLAERTRNHPEP